MTAPASSAHATPAHPDAGWWRQAAVYQIYPRSFADANGDGMGDLPGVTARMGYLSALGIDAIWLSPFYPSALADGGYDVDDYRNVDPRLGSLADFDAMVSAAHAAGIRIIVDVVPNHSSNRHEWFKAALAAAPGSPERARYQFFDGLPDGLGDDGGLPPSDWPSHFGGGAWTRVVEQAGPRAGQLGQWYLHLFATEQPDFNWDNPEVREDFHTTLRFWADRGVDGFRVDVAHGLAKDMTLPLRSKPELEILVDDGSDPLFDRDEVHEIFAGWRDVLNEYNPPKAAVAEAWVPFTDRRLKYARPTELGQAFNFDLLQAHFDGAEFRAIAEKCLSEAEASGASSTWVFSNHDVVRHASRYALPDSTTLETLNAWLMDDGASPEPDLARGLRRARAATLFMLGLPGSAYLYQGEELGLFEVADLPHDSLQDPTWFRTGNTLKGRDGCRVPLPWSSSEPNFGFGGTPWLPQPEWFGPLAADAQDGVAGSTLEMYRAALKLRRELQSEESLEWLSAPGAGVVHYRRPNGWQVITNFGAAAAKLPSGVDLSKLVITSGETTTAGGAATGATGGTVTGATGTSATIAAETTLWLAP
ncbi:alpha-glucosidase [Arthrobacter stackebrandtii]|uniref:Alpha-glucosidase n=1 Tax=Arthrobacter stackebrandtii TaxID=272161 RepID=A0ABS4YX23_9MICC|nr:glycoside hydrolase family 13 protein [Arthrobacter stackebrandtii]MBP2413365.1 alpha-glucosidase [Arthrobacter stackebrandtii]PYG99543.1 alpha-amylase [Arthrobacter stackebrandtii]